MAIVPMRTTDGETIYRPEEHLELFPELVSPLPAGGDAATTVTADAAGAAAKDAVTAATGPAAPGTDPAAGAGEPGTSPRAGRRPAKTTEKEAH
ncbi:hypothetical protein NBM05_08430 [Rothia sp. AR01]|uniref:Uncharacterized protein n=1 Tax=Rothia santali TaxID=2949643 RepID=A0A9X2HE45_9MICC|nr:hypothetical protein [Rothia santali]MCP3426027.1 hypothetical protein [Rothia santali]